eukprot:scaffold2065_cov107-Cylindrotheca_fusiformis.AAC.5
MSGSSHQLLHESAKKILPPSPELKPSTRNLPESVDSQFSLDASPANAPTASQSQRLRSIARYQSFYPQALACSDTLTVSTQSDLIDEPQPTGVSSTLMSTQSQKHKESRRTPPSGTTSSLGALAGPQGVALFRLARPHIPLLVLSHATNSTSKRSSISSLAFQPNAGDRSLYLAATRGSASLIWDASGHSTMPLIGRLGSESNAADSLDAHITSMCWKPSSQQASSTSPLLATTTANSISLWDLRVAPQGSTSSFKPTLRIGTSRQISFSKSSAIAPKIVQVACASESDELATIDTTGIVRIYDVRMTERHRAPSTSGSASSTFRAHATAGVGLAYFPTTAMKGSGENSTSSSWLTWGLDSPKASAVAKLWSWTSSDSQEVSTDPDDYRHPNSIPFNRSEYCLNAQLVRPNLACARICPVPMKNSFMAVGHYPYYNATQDEKSMHSPGGWWAELCTLTSETVQAPVSDSLFSTTFGVRSVVKFEGGGGSGYDWGQKALLSALGGRDDLGRLQAAELAFSGISNQSHSLTPGVEYGLDRSLPDEAQDGNVELVLCCLSDTAVITTHAIPEAMPKSPSNRSGGSELSPGRTRLVRTAFNTSSQPRVYPEDRKEGASLVDAAGFWNSNYLGAGELLQSARDELGRPLPEQKQSPQKNTLLQKMDPNLADPNTTSTGLQLGEGGILPFDLEVPVAYGSVSANPQVAMTDMNSGTVLSSGGLEETEPVSTDVRETTPILENIESERVPCPPLCGATFGFGNGGLVMFHNGEIKKMWNWFQRTDTIRLASVPSRKTDISASDELLSSRINASIRDNYGPRTLKELANMMKTAKEAQWGERDGSDDSGSEGQLSADDNFFEEESLDSNSSDSGDDGSLAQTSNDHLYNRYFGSTAWKGTVEKGGNDGSHRRQNSESSAATPTRKTVPFVGPSYDMLAPVVRVTHELDSAIVSHQSLELAQGWELGVWQAPTFSGSLESAKGKEERSNLSIFELETASLLPDQELPHYRFLSPNPPAKGSSTMSRTKSDPSMSFKSLAQRLRASNMDEKGVHGGEYSVRPSMEDSMKFLKKLFSHQHDVAGSFPNMLSPPDNPLQWDRHSSSVSNIQSLDDLSPDKAIDESRQTVAKSEGYGSSSSTKKRDLGVYTLRKESMKGEVGREVEVLRSIKDICLHNAEVCTSVGETNKEGVWNLLAQTVDGQIGNKESGWGGAGGGALGMDLVSGLLEYYERLGDAQMLATMFCVLSGGFRSPLQSGSPKLLPQGQDEKYDAYIRKYAELLYAWGLLSVRAELNKHLLRVPSSCQQESKLEDNKPHKQMLSSRGGHGGNKDDHLSLVGIAVDDKTDGGGGSSGGGPRNAGAPGVAVIFHCPRCGQDTDKNTNMCRYCQDFAFRCSICDNAVRGLFTVCSICNHGGHVEHMKSWFSDQVQCPTGCGCQCTFVPKLTNKNSTTTSTGATAAVATTGNSAPATILSPPDGLPIVQQGMGQPLLVLDF